ncbi:MAG: DNA polymerase III subunit gamma/tau [Rhodospirillaceae bacterium]
MDDLITTSESGAYRVLARKYRPTTFADLKGQEALVQTLSNAFAQGRVAHAFVLTGVRGVGKTTTARIIAKGLNCLSADGPTVSPCGQCDNCLAIGNDRHVDVIEMDAASRTGVDDIREIIEGVRYKPVSARFKVYIIDEVHMLSRNAFNALLKTLEEPPPHVKFVFATTEIRKVPITVLSRCQRFDLRRLDTAALIALFTAVAEKEAVSIADEAVAAIARAADGSARDGLSILDQAMAMAEGMVTADQVRTMLGVADRTQIYDLFETLLDGRLPDALEILARLHAHGVDPLVMMQDLLDLTHWVTKAKTAPATLAEAGLSDLERQRGGQFAEKLSVPVLGRTWQILLKGIGEVQMASRPMQACEMVLIRLAHISDLPSPGDLVKQLTNAPATAAADSTGTPAAAAPPTAQSAVSAPMSSTAQPVAASNDRPAAVPRSPAMPVTASESEGPADAAVTLAVPESGSDPGDQAAQVVAHPEAEMPADFAAIVGLFESHREAVLQTHLIENVRPVEVAAGRLIFQPLAGAPKDLASLLANRLRTFTAAAWHVESVPDGGQPSLSELRQTARLEAEAEVARDPVVRAVLDAFPGATIESIKDLRPVGEAALTEAPIEDDDFDDDLDADGEPISVHS